MQHNNKLNENIQDNNTQRNEDNQKLIKRKNAFEGIIAQLKKKSNALIDDQKIKVDEENNKRKKLSEDFQKKLEVLSKTLEEHTLENMKRQKENEILKEKYKEISKQIDDRKTQIGDEMNKKETDSHKHDEEMNDKFKALEGESLGLNSLQKEFEDAKGSEDKVKNEFQDCMNKSQEFQNSMEQYSLELNQLKKDMGDLCTNIQVLETENYNLNIKCDKSDKAIAEMNGENTYIEKENKTIQDKIEILKNLGKTMEKSLVEKEQEIETLTKNN